ncbi:MAG: hypothetical protein ACRDP3_18220 [Streptomyces sp.]|uniref:hypothetical protein n=1 Tax=Streptomyces sp. TaxID=1931 RepID=UPI003D6B002D
MDDERLRPIRAREAKRRLHIVLLILAVVITLALVVHLVQVLVAFDQGLDHP